MLLGYVVWSKTRRTMMRFWSDAGYRHPVSYGRQRCRRDCNRRGKRYSQAKAEWGLAHRSCTPTCDANRSTPKPNSLCWSTRLLLEPNGFNSGWILAIGEVRLPAGLLIETGKLQAGAPRGAAMLKRTFIYPFNDVQLPDLPAARDSRVNTCFTTRLECATPCKNCKLKLWAFRTHPFTVAIANMGACEAAS